MTSHIHISIPTVKPVQISSRLGHCIFTIIMYKNNTKMGENDLVFQKVSIYFLTNCQNKGTYSDRMPPSPKGNKFKYFEFEVEISMIMW